MSNRSRERVQTLSTGRCYTRNGANDYYYSNWDHFERAVDFVAPGDGHDLTINKVRLTGGRINSANKNGGTSNTFIWDNCLPTNLRVGSAMAAQFNHISIPGRPTNESLAAQLCAGTNPSRPYVDLPVALWELREIPSLLKEEGEDWIKRMASGHLKYQFGIAPLMNDLRSLILFSDEVDKREKELNALRSSGLRRRRNLWKGSIPGTYSISLNSDRGANTGTRTLNKVTTTSCWGHVVWYPEKHGLLMKGDSRNLAKRAMLGMTIDFATAWNMMPWSWLIDWCTNVGQVLIGARNIVGAYHGPVRIMEHTRTTTTHGSLSWSGSAENRMDPFTVTRETKTRRTTWPVFSAHLPILTAKQLSILGSIGVTRRVPRSW